MFRRSSIDNKPAMLLPRSPGPVWAATPAPPQSMVRSEPVAAFDAGMVLVALYLLTIYSRLPELLSIVLGIAVPLAMGVTAVSLVGVILFGSVLRILTEKVTLLLIAYTGWMMLVIPFSLWRGGSFQVLTEQWLRSLAMFFIVAALLTSLRHLRIALLALMIAVLVVVVFSLRLTSYIEGRFTMAHGTFGNPNLLSIHLLIMLPVCGYFLFEKKAAMWLRVLALATMASSMLIVLKTGSRTGMVVFGAILFVTFLQQSWANRIKLIAATLLFSIAGLLFLPKDVTVRYLLLFRDSNSLVQSDALYSDEDFRSVAAAEGSSALRRKLMMQAIRLTLTHPIVGVGPGSVAISDSEEQSGQAYWKESHNIYLQISAEMGIPGIALYLAIAILSIRQAWRIRKLTKGKENLQNLHRMASALFMMQFAYGLGGIFSTSTYGMYMPMFAALSLALHEHGTAAIRRASSSQPRHANSLG